MTLQLSNRRQSIRLKDYDYSASGAYFVTICTYERACLLGDVIEEQVHFSEFGRIVSDVWNRLPEHYGNLELDAFVVMPNHVHGIMLLDDEQRAGSKLRFDKPAPTHAALSEIVRAFKTFSSRACNAVRGTTGKPFWQRSFYEHIIRDEVSLNKIREYILSNPASWSTDKENPGERG